MVESATATSATGVLPLVTCGRAAQMLGVSSSMIRVLDANGKLRALRTRDGLRLFLVEQVEQLAAERAERKAPRPRE